MEFGPLSQPPGIARLSAYKDSETPQPPAKTSTGPGGRTAPEAARFNRRHALQIALGLVALVAGFFAYALWRAALPPLIDAVVGHRLHLAWQPTGAWATLRDNGPSFFHVLGFSLLTAGLLAAPTPGPGLWGTAFWTVVNVVLELLQGLGPAAKARLIAALPWRMELFERFLLGGVFDRADLLAAAAGGLVAAAAIVLTQAQGDRHAA